MVSQVKQDLLIIVGMTLVGLISIGRPFKIFVFAFTSFVNIAIRILCEKPARSSIPLLFALLVFLLCDCCALFLMMTSYDVEWRERPLYDTNLFIVAMGTGLNAMLHLRDVYRSLQAYEHE